MKSRLIASVMAATVAFTTMFTTPAAALDDVERRNLLLGLFALATIGAALNEQNKGNRPPVSHGPSHPGGGWGNGRIWLPASCEFPIRTRDGVRDVLGSQCLQANQVAVARLPNRCEFTIRTTRGPRDVFGSSCLEREGYRIEARR